MDFDKIIEEYSKQGQDFGFTSGVDVGQLQERASVAENTANAHKSKLKEVENLILPLLVNLMNSKGDTIKWPEETRKKQIKDQIEKILKLTRV